ncbi:type 2 lanthipeptide synthetase LanM family protein [Priestia megaterium]|uniref:type 2 lanthipeptide synthetase LanM family protein n=1 Tax=Priestia megaterium TaxID=1404 RepID=UPI00366EA5DB
MTSTSIKPQYDYKKASFLNERIYEFTNIPESTDNSRYNYWNQFIGIEELVNKSIEHRNLSETAFRKILNSDNYKVKELKEPYNIKELKDFYNIVLPNFLTNNPQESKSYKFFAFLKPFLKLAYGKLQQNIHQNEFVLSSNAKHEVLFSLSEQLLKISIRTLILELNVARLSGKLVGETSEERYNYFNDVLLNDEDFVQAIYAEYPLLIRLLLTTSNRWAQNVGDIINCYCLDRKEISETLGINKNSHIASLKIGTGDLHKKGKSVAHLQLSDNKKIVYKPRPLDLDYNFQKLLEWFNSKEIKFSLYQTKMVKKELYGWTEFIDFNTCTNEDEIIRFYHRMGNYLGLLYSINAVDFHYENIIAMGDQPILVDLEAIFHQDVVKFTGETAFDRSQKFIQESVLQIGLLPTNFFSNKDSKGIDLSGIGGTEGQYFPNKVSTIDKNNSDEMTIVKKRVQIPSSNNRPKLNEKYTDPYSYTGNIIAGFREVYSLLLNHQEEFNKKIHTLFSEVQTRQIIRQTKRYSDMLQIGNHPDFLRDGLDREMLVDKLWIDTLYVPDLEKVLNSEREDILLGDVPIFTTKPGEPHIWDSTGKCIENFFKQDSLSICQRRINSLSVKDMEQQIEIIETSMLSIKKPENRRISKPNEDLFYPVEEYLNEAIKIGEYLQNKAIYGLNEGKKDVCWVGCNLIGDEEFEWKINPVGMNLYDGLGGIALFFGYLYKLTKREDFKETAKEALVPVLSSMKKPSYPNIGAFAGLTSDIYVLSHMSVLLEEPELLENAYTLLDLLEGEIDKDNQYDIIGGVSGTIIVLLDLYEHVGIPRLLEIAHKCGIHLSKNAVPAGNSGGIAWKGLSAENPLGGFAHGVSGIIVSLMKLQNHLKGSPFQDIIQGALLFERELFVPEKGNWYDLRSVKGQTHKDLNILPTAWCHGAAGICLSRIMSMEYGYEDPLFEEEINVALDTTIKSGFIKDHSLCHGDIGNIEILNYANRHLKSDSLTNQINKYQSRLLSEIKEGICWSGLPTLHETPGLMIGLSGIGLGLLKLYRPNQVPSVLKLDPAHIFIN